MIKFWKYSRKKNPLETPEEKSLRQKYQAFLTILSENEHALHLMSDLETKYYAHQLVSIPYIRNIIRNLSRAVMTIVEHLNVLASDHYKGVTEVADEINATVREIISGQRDPLFTPIVIPIADISIELVDKVGSKMANLGELRRHLDINVPDGFALTACAYQHFIDYNALAPKIASISAHLDINDSHQLLEAERTLKELFRRSLVPPEIEQEIEKQCRRFEQERGHPMLWAIRSSAIGEDLENSFAGQFSTLLNVNSSQIVEKHKEVMASKYNARAIVYRRIKRIRDEDVNLSLGVMEMIDPETSGVIYTANPLQPDDKKIIINAVWGIGQLLADGIVSADTYVLRCRNHFTVEKQDIAEKQVCLVSTKDGGVYHEVVPSTKCSAACLSEAQMQEVARAAAAIEQYFQYPQDIEWCFDKAGRLFILQARPLRVTRTVSKPSYAEINAPILIDGAQPLSAGVGIGKVCKISSTRELIDFPKGAVLVAKKSSPHLVKAIHRVTAVVVEGGNPTDHMAPIVREFGVPCIVKADKAFTLLENGREVTVDANMGRVYQGRIPELLDTHTDTDRLLFDPTNTESYRLLERLIKIITTLNLTDPRSRDFTLGNCKSWHDVIRFCHEAALNEMFSFSEKKPLSKIKNVYRVETDLPFDLHVLDLFHNTIKSRQGKTVLPEQIGSLPFQSLWKGVSRNDIPWSGPPVVYGSKGFVSAFLRVPAYEMNTADTKSFAVVTPEYLNLSLSMGFHYVVLDAYLSHEPYNNYITLSFKGGAANSEQRRLRVLFVANILKALDFQVHTVRDFLKARIKTEPVAKLSGKLDIIGRMLGVTRLLDVALRDEQMVEEGVARFFEGDYSLGFLMKKEKE